MALTLKHFLLFLFGLNAIVMYLHAIAANKAAQQESLRTENLLFTMHPSTNPPLQEPESSETILEENQHEIEIMQLELTKAQKLIAQLTIEKEELERTANQTTKISDNFSNKFEVAKKTHSYALEMLVKTNPFRKLGLYETMPSSYYNSRTRDSFIPNTQYYKIKHNPGYCDSVDLYNFHNPDNIFKNMNFISDYGGEELLIRKEVMRKIGNDVMPGVSVVTNPKQHQQPVYDMAINGTMFFFKVAVIHNLYQMNKEWACLTQTYNHIPGSGVISRKDLLAKTINNYSQRYINKPQCLSEETFFPRVYRLDVQSECNAFFNIFNSEQYEKNKANEPLQFLIKIGSGAHRAKGVFLLDQDYEAKLRDTYQNGQSCGRVQNTYIAQKYISNPLLLDRQNKFDFRIYMLVASTNPLIVYYHDGFLRISLSKYDKYSTEKNVHLTNTHLSKDVFKKAKEGNQFDGMNEQELRDYQMWTMEDLERYLLATGKIQDQDWLNNYLRPKFKEAFVHIARMAESSFYNSSSVFEMYGLDFVIDENLNLWFIECNPSPQMVGTNTKKTEFLVRMVQDLFEIQYAYLRSRMKRVFTFVRKMEERAQNGEELDYTKLKGEFDAVNINKLEPEFQISENNSFTLILDKNMNGSEAYFGNLAPECVDV